jgi:hypothetical protein
LKRFRIFINTDAWSFSLGAEAILYSFTLPQIIWQVT